ncbi:phytanoyl-CoA dioxygenase family protein [Pseudomonas sp. NPDC007930]|uniref:phytanoyl-CoA dioxygenase family protein n=1 Tax=Pseudomonas sp. NPDC007930 TaxID=3364417 RepID=UPI0036F0DEFB
MASLFADASDCQLADFSALCQQQVNPGDYPLCERVQHNVVVFAGERLLAAAQGDRRAVLGELHRVLSSGPGVLVIEGGYSDTAVVDRHSQVFEQILERERLSNSGGDHFAAAGSNGRIWNALQKAALLSPDSFIEYYANPLLALASEAWLGPAYQVTAQVNVVRPGGKAQAPHRDYHLGFQVAEEVARFPLPLHQLSQYLTLQGAVAHTDMPLESGPTQLLPFSHQYPLGYLAWRLPAFAEYFQRHLVQLPLRKGDLLFFNPALFHAAGNNRTEAFHRMANLLQVSSAFGKPMESIDRPAMARAVYPALLRRFQGGELSPAQCDAVIGAVGDGYAFPTNLDTDPPLKDLAPPSEQAVLHQALAEGWAANTLGGALAARAKARQP